MRVIYAIPYIAYASIKTKRECLWGLDLHDHVVLVEKVLDDMLLFNKH